MKLYVFKICPFVERVQIVAKEKNTDCEQIHVDIRNKPQWYLDLPGSSTVPKLEITNQQHKTFYIPDTIAVCNLFDELGNSTLQPKDPATQALNTYWIHQLTPIMGNAYNMSLSSEQKDLESYKEKLFVQLKILENLLTDIKPCLYFNGKDFTMIDIAYAPQFKRFECMNRLYGLNVLTKFPLIKQWSDATLNIPSVSECLNNKIFDENYKELVSLRNSCMQLKEI
jgi:glutathione S-transferase